VVRSTLSTVSSVLCPSAQRSMPASKGSIATKSSASYTRGPADLSLEDSVGPYPIYNPTANLLLKEPVTVAFEGSMGFTQSLPSGTATFLAHLLTLTSGFPSANPPSFLSAAALLSALPMTLPHIASTATTRGFPFKIAFSFLEEVYDVLSQSSYGVDYFLTPPVALPNCLSTVKMK
jgi:hypothetical protein